MLANARSALKQHPAAAPLMLTAMGHNLSGHSRVVIFGDPRDPATIALIRAARSASSADIDLLLVDSPATTDRLEPAIPDILSYVPKDNRPAVYVCAGGACHPPASDPEEVRRLLLLNK
jgi:uncharacterized protein YyaL (SSP411 family)